MCLILFLSTKGSFSANSDWQKDPSDAVKTRLIASFYHDENGQQKLIAGIHFLIGKGWKIYGQGADESSIGLPPSVDLNGSENYLAHQIVWPKPKIGEEKIGQESIKFFFYEDEIILPIEIDPKKNDQLVKLKIQLNYGLCKDVCIAANANFSLSILPEEDFEALREIQKFYPKKILSADSSKEIFVQSQPIPKPSFSFIYAILLALLGGAILNIMPCVLPVLSIKIFSILHKTHIKVHRIRLAFLATVLGIIFCFMAFAVFASLIKITGGSLGWGLQFQNPYFLIFLIIILMFLIANLLGIFEIGFNQFLATILNKKISQSEEKKNIFIPNFLSGILAVLLATPCSAPFLGSAISFALVQQVSVIFLIFLFIGIGFALPYILLSLAPGVVYLLPKPGKWMFKVKQILAGFLVATLVWLDYVLSHNIGLLPSLLVAALAPVLLVCFKIKNNFPKFLVFGVIIIAIFIIPTNWHQKQQIEQEVSSNLWQKFDEEKISKLVLEGKTVIIDITADWCITCKFNKIRVFEDREVMTRLANQNIVAMRGDLTKPDEKILNFLHKNGRFAIPFNAVYGPKAKEGLLANELLTKKELLSLIAKASQ